MGKRILVTIGLVILMITGVSFSAGAQPTLEERVTQLEAQVTQLENTVNQLVALLQGVSRTGNDITFSGMNVYIVNGTGSTDGSVNGLGNLIVGYNEPRIWGGDDRSGSHNIVVGGKHNYSSYGGLVGGYQNTISGPYANVSGGNVNEASGGYASVSGGGENKASGQYAGVSGGCNKIASGQCECECGGWW